MIRNVILAVLISAMGWFIYNVLVLTPEQREIALYIISGAGLVIFFVQGRFGYYGDIILKSIAIVVMDAAIIYGVSFIPELPVKITVAIAAILIVTSIIGIKIYTVVIMRRNLELLKKGKVIETTLEEIVKMERKYDYWYFKTSWTDPESGKQYYFESNLILNDPSDKITPGDTIKVLFNKDRPGHYHVNITDFSGKRKIFVDHVIEKYGLEDKFNSIFRV